IMIHYAGARIFFIFKPNQVEPIVFRFGFTELHSGFLPVKKILFLQIGGLPQLFLRFGDRLRVIAFRWCLSAFKNIDKLREPLAVLGRPLYPVATKPFPRLIEPSARVLWLCPFTYD